MTYDKLGILISFVALILSIVSLVYSWIIDKRRDEFNKKTIMSEFFKTQYFAILTSELPEQMNKFKEGNKDMKLNILLEIEDIVIKILDNSTFYKYYENEFYQELKEIIIKNQDITAEIGNSLARDSYRIDLNEKKFEENISTLYDAMMEYYSS